MIRALFTLIGWVLLLPMVLSALLFGSTVILIIHWITKDNP